MPKAYFSGESVLVLHKSSHARHAKAIAWDAIGKFDPALSTSSGKTQHKNRNAGVTHENIEHGLQLCNKTLNRLLELIR